MERKQFTFYESFYRAMRKIKNKAVRADIFDSICAYALYEVAPDEDAINPVALAIFEMARPVLDTARKKACGPAGKTAERSEEEVGKTEQTSAIDEGKEKEIEIETEKEIERESVRAGAGVRAREDFEIFWKEFPKKVDKQKAWVVFQGVEAPLKALMDALRKQKKSEQWLDAGGRYIPRPAAWLRERRWEDELAVPAKVPMGASGELGEAELAAIRRMMEEPVDS